MSTVRTNVAEAIQTVEQNQTIVLRTLKTLEQRTQKLEQLADLFEKAITDLTNLATQQHDELNRQSADLDRAMTDIDAIQAT